MNSLGTEDGVSLSLTSYFLLYIHIFTYVFTPNILLDLEHTREANLFDILKLLYITSLLSYTMLYYMF